MTGTTGSAGAVAGPRVLGEQYRMLHVQAVQVLAGEVGITRLTRRMVASDVIRGRTSNTERCGEAIADAALHGADPVRVRAVGQAVCSWFRTLVSAARASLIDCWERETREQGEADIAQRRALTSHDASVIEHAIAETDEHVAAALELRDALADRLSALRRGGVR
jgi:hypothetical protein